uniref:DNA primase n=1 Tax=Leptocylindrus danicus TaxID=163516 RepID=A0A7S2P2T7_9STRA
MAAADEPMQDTTTTATDGASKKTENKPSNKVQYDKHQLATYYARLFPFDFMHSWLSYNNDHGNGIGTFQKREWSFTIDVNGEEVYMRYQSFANEKELATSVRKRNPQKIDIGAVFSHPPKDHKAIKNISPVQRELVFDVDLTDYDAVRTCCTGANICRRCWPYMNMAIKVMDVGLKEDFGFEHVFWVYSGRRGVHAWISDEDARMLSNDARSAVAHYFEVQCESENNKEGLKLHSPMHPLLTRSFSILEPMFIQYIIPFSGQGLLADSESWTKLLRTLPSGAQNIVENLTKKWKASDSEPADKWEDLKRQIGIVVGKGKSTKGKGAQYLKGDDRVRVEMWPYETVFKHTYPRLDINVSTHQNHLLKSPFCVHPKTGRVCVPIDSTKIDQFDPFQVPTLPQLMTELDEYEKVNGKEKNDENRKSVRDWEKTSLKSSFSHFEGQLKQLQKRLRRNQRDLADKDAAILGEF